MPSFPAYASLLARGMAAKAWSPIEEVIHPSNPARVEIGNKLWRNVTGDSIAGNVTELAKNSHEATSRPRSR